MNLHYYFTSFTLQNVFLPSIELSQKSTLYQLNLVEQLNLIKNYFKHLILRNFITNNLVEITNLQDGSLQMTCQFVQL